MIRVCEVDESGGMADLAAAEKLLTAAYGPGKWVPNPTTPTTRLNDAGALLDGCDETGDCPADVHTSICWRGYWKERQ